MLHFGEIKVETSGGLNVSKVQVFLGNLDPQVVQMELYADSVRDRSPERQEMKLSAEPSGVPGSHVYIASVSAGRPPGDYTTRVMPHCDGVAVPLEASQILWQR